MPSASIRSAWSMMSTPARAYSRIAMRDGQCARTSAVVVRDPTTASISARVK
jgi:hypothetical protein